jgi:hypothetical protein
MLAGVNREELRDMSSFSGEHHAYGHRKAQEPVNPVTTGAAKLTPLNALRRLDRHFTTAHAAPELDAALEVLWEYVMKGGN